MGAAVEKIGRRLCGGTKISTLTLWASDSRGMHFQLPPSRGMYDLVDDGQELTISDQLTHPAKDGLRSGVKGVPWHTGRKQWGPWLNLGTFEDESDARKESRCAVAFLRERGLTKNIPKHVRGVNPLPSGKWYVRHHLGYFSLEDLATAVDVKSKAEAAWTRGRRGALLSYNLL